MNGPIRRVALALFLGFMALVLSVTYWQIIAADRLRAHPDNTRVLLDRSGRERGWIVSADAVVLARSATAAADPGYTVRQYPHGPLYAHTVGFSSPLLGDTGIEQSHAGEITAGSDLTVSGIISTLLGEDLRPRSLQLTLNHGLQQVAARALAGRSGAVVAIDPLTGQVLAMVSSPSFDPNTLVGADAETVWESLEGDAALPLEDRSTGRYLAQGETRVDLVPAPDAELDPSRATPLDLALRTAAVASGGVLMRPHLVARTFDAEGAVTAETSPAVLARLFSPEAADGLEAGMDRLAIRTARSGEVSGAGLAGVDEAAADLRIGWFAGFAPADGPSIAVAVRVLSPDAPAAEGAAASEAAAIGRRVITAWLDR